MHNITFLYRLSHYKTWSPLIYQSIGIQQWFIATSFYYNSSEFENYVYYTVSVLDLNYLKYYVFLLSRNQDDSKCCSRSGFIFCHQFPIFFEKDSFSIFRFLISSWIYDIYHIIIIRYQIRDDFSQIIANEIKK